VTFLLMTAVFSRITILQLDLPSANSTVVSTPSFRLEVIVRKEGFELTNGHALIATIPKVAAEYDLKSLGDLVLSLKRDYPDADDASVLLQPDIAYDHLIQVMDVVRSAELPVNSELLATLKPVATPSPMPAAAPTPGLPKTLPPQNVRVALFTDIALTVAYIAPIILGSAWRPAQAPWHHTAILMMLSFPMWVGWAVPTAVAASATVLASSRERGATRAAVLIAVGIGILLLVGASALDSSSHDLRRDFAFASGFARKNPELYKRPLWELRSVFRTRLDAINEQDRKARLRFERPHTGIQLREHGHQVGTTALTLIACALLGAAWARRRFPQIAAIVAGVLALQFIFAFATLYSTPIYGRIVVAWSQAVLLFLTSLLLFGRMSKRVLRFGL